MTDENYLIRCTYTISSDLFFKEPSIFRALAKEKFRIEIGSEIWRRLTDGRSRFVHMFPPVEQKSDVSNFVFTIQVALVLIYDYRKSEIGEFTLIDVNHETGTTYKEIDDSTYKFKHVGSRIIDHETIHVWQRVPLARKDDDNEHRAINSDIYTDNNVYRNWG